MSPKRRVIQIHANDDRLAKIEAITAHLEALGIEPVSQSAALEFALNAALEKIQQFNTARGGSAHTALEGAESE